MNPCNNNVPVSNIVVRIKSEETTIKDEFLIYDTYSLNYDDPVLNTLVEATMKKYAGNLVDPDITITTKITWVKE